VNDTISVPSEDGIGERGERGKIREEGKGRGMGDDKIRME